jgi:tetrahydromethanopterin S-methyltransferase subunit F
MHAHLPSRVDERRELSVPQHADGVAAGTAVQSVRDDAHLVARAQRMDARHLLQDRSARLSLTCSV